MALALEFDPSVGGPATVAAVLESSHTTGPLFLSQGPTTIGGGGMMPSVHPYRVLSAKSPPPLAPVVGSDAVGSAWFTVDVTPPTLAVLNGFANALGTTGVTTLFYYWALDCEFRMRT